MVPVEHRPDSNSWRFSPLIQSGVKAWGITIAAGILAISPTFNLPRSVEIIATVASGPLFYLGGPLRRRHYEDLEVKRLTIVFELERRIVNERNVSLPWLSPQRSTVGGKADAILRTLEAKADLELSFLGVQDAYRFVRYGFEVRGLNHWTDVFEAREFVRNAVGHEGSVFFSFEGGVFGVDLSKPQRDSRFPSVSNREWIGNSRQLILFAMGVDSRNQLKTVPAGAEFGHMKLTGGTRSGKTWWIMAQCQFLMQRHTSREIGLSVIEVKNSPTFRPAEWERYPHFVCPVANDFITGFRVLLWHLQEAYRRGELFKQMGCDTLDQFNRRSVEQLPHLYCFVCEAMSFLDPNSALPGYRALFIGLTTEWVTKFAGVGVHLILEVQRSGAGENDPFHKALSLRSNFGLLACTKTETPQDALLGLNTEEGSSEPLAYEAAHLQIMGDMIYRYQEHGGLVRVQGLTPIDPSETLQIMEPLIDGGEWELPDLTDEIVSRYVPSAKPLKAAGTASTSQGVEISENDRRTFYERYRALREGREDGNQYSLSKALQKIGGFKSDGGDSYLLWKDRARVAVLQFLDEWISDMPSEWTDLEIFDRVWSKRAKDKGDRELFLSRINQIRGEHNAP